jgi:hypothetical protein
VPNTMESSISMILVKKATLPHAAPQPLPRARARQCCAHARAWWYTRLLFACCGSAFYVCVLRLGSAAWVRAWPHRCEEQQDVDLRGGDDGPRGVLEVHVERAVEAARGGASARQRARRGLGIGRRHGGNHAGVRAWGRRDLRDGRGRAWRGGAKASGKRAGGTIQGKVRGLTLSTCFRASGHGDVVRERGIRGRGVRRAPRDRASSHGRTINARSVN